MSKRPPRSGIVALAGLVLVEAALLTGYAFTDRIVGFLPHATWFVVLFVVVTFVPLLWWGRRHDPAIRWIFDRLARRRGS